MKCIIIKLKNKNLKDIVGRNTFVIGHGTNSFLFAIGRICNDEAILFIRPENIEILQVDGEGDITVIIALKHGESGVI